MGLGEATGIAAGCVTVAAAVASHVLVERPFLRLKDRLRRRAGDNSHGEPALTTAAGTAAGGTR